MESLDAWILTWRAGGCYFSHSRANFLTTFFSFSAERYSIWVKVRTIPSPWAWALILGVFVKVRKTPPPNFAHLRAGKAGSEEFCAMASHDLQSIAGESMGEWCKRRGVYAFFGTPLRGKITKDDRWYIHVYSIEEPSLADEVAKSKEKD